MAFRPMALCLLLLAWHGGNILKCMSLYPSPFKQSQVGFAQTTIQKTGTHTHTHTLHTKERVNPCHCLLVEGPNIHAGSVSEMKYRTGSPKWPLHYYIFSSRKETKLPIHRDKYAKTNVIKVTVTFFFATLPLLFKLLQNHLSFPPSCLSFHIWAL